MNLAQEENLDSIWQERFQTLKGRGIDFISFNAQYIREHVNPHFQSTPLGKTRFVNTVSSKSPDTELVDKFLKAADAILMREFLGATKPWHQKKFTIHDTSIDAISTDLTGIQSMLDHDHPIFDSNSDQISKTFPYPVLYPQGAGFNVDINTYCIADLDDIPRTSTMRIVGKYERDRIWGMDAGSVDTVEEVSYLRASTVFPQQASNRPEADKTPKTRIITPIEALQLQEMGENLLSMREKFEQSGIPQHAERVSGWCSTIENSNRVIESALG